jgi:hypothetical protein
MMLRKELLEKNAAGRLENVKRCSQLVATSIGLAGTIVKATNTREADDDTPVLRLNRVTLPATRDANAGSPKGDNQNEHLANGSCARV